MTTLVDSILRKLTYHTVQVVEIKNVKLSLLFRLIQAGLVVIILVRIILGDGYQSVSPIVGSSSITLTGSAVNLGGIPWLNQTFNESGAEYPMIFDSYDLIYPPLEPDAVFITTNFRLINQTRGVCYPALSEWITGLPFDNTTGTVNRSYVDSQCQVICARNQLMYEDTKNTGGITTGNHRISLLNNTSRLGCSCELYTWCKDEETLSNQWEVAKQQQSEPDGHFRPSISMNLSGFGDWILAVKQNVYFASFSERTDNTYDPDKDDPSILFASEPSPNDVPSLPRSQLDPRVQHYHLKEVFGNCSVDRNNVNDCTMNNILQNGSVVLMLFKWDCNLDDGINWCEPQVNFIFLSDSYSFPQVQPATPDYPFGGNRTLIRRTGIRIVIATTGEVKRFSLVVLFTNLAAGISILTVASLVADFLALNFLPERLLYQQAKIKQVTVDQGRLRGMTGIEIQTTTTADRSSTIRRTGRTGPDPSESDPTTVDPSVVPISMGSDDAEKLHPTRLQSDSVEEPWGKRQP